MDITYRYDRSRKIEQPREPDALVALKAMEAGHLRYLEIIDRIKAVHEGEETPEPLVIHVDPLRLGFPGASGVPKHTPFALVLGCSDARAPIERIFDQSPNDLFVIRVAGNVLGTECLGSIDYAVRQLGGSLSLVAVLGHTGCGAVTAAVDMYLAPQDYPSLGLTYALRTLVDRVLIAVRGAAKAIVRVRGYGAKEHAGYRSALIETAVYLNAALTSFDVRREVEMFQSDSRFKVVYGVYSLTDQRVRSLPDHDGTSAPPFAEVASQPVELTELGDRIVKAIVARGDL